MSISALSSGVPPIGVLASNEPALGSKAGRGNSPEEAAKAAKQFEAVLVRQLLEPSLQAMMSGMGGAGGAAGSDVYGYFFVDSLANAITDGGGLGLSSILQMQFTGNNPDNPETSS
jgi:Rod binding domain-containing protein